MNLEDVAGDDAFLIWELPSELRICAHAWDLELRSEDDAKVHAGVRRSTSTALIGKNKTASTSGNKVARQSAELEGQ